MPPVAERLRRAYPALPERVGVGSIPANSDAQNVPSFRRWRFEMKLKSLFFVVENQFVILLFQYPSVVCFHFVVVFVFLTTALVSSLIVTSGPLLSTLCFDDFIP
jgi:hypothetical protein